MVGVLPFENSIIQLELTGEQLIYCIDDLLPGGMTTVGGYKFLDGTPVDYNTTYTVLTTDYLYSLSNSDFSKYDPDPEFTSSNYRDPTIDWIKSLNSTTQDPLNNYLDNTPRR
jgi:2',3'-cyclic-nucleotide 2'-phosphodiesterase (5'-nucleotidase family)